MDLEDEGWVNVPCDGLLEVHDDGNEKIFSRKYVKSPTKFYKQYYFDASHTSQDYVKDESMFEEQMDHEEEVKEMIELPILITEPKETLVESETKPPSDKDPIFQIFLKEENQFVETNVCSPRESPQQSALSSTETGAFQYKEKNDDHVVDYLSPSKMVKKEVVDWQESNQGLKFWKFGLNGIGVFCSLGMAAATLCIILCGNDKRHKQQNQKLKLQIHQDNKMIKQVVQKANEAMSAVIGVPLVNAKITYGGHYEIPLAS